MMVVRADSDGEKLLLDRLVDARLLIPSGVPGLYGRGAVFEDVIERFDALITATVRGDGAERWRFPPGMSKATLEESGFLDSMPQLAGAVVSFTGAHAEHPGEHEEGASRRATTEVALTPAACYPVYPAVARDGPIPRGGRLVDVLSYCFRNEPSLDPARQQMFRQRELVRIAEDEEQARAWRDRWIARGLSLLSSIGLHGVSAPANDPFFGRSGRMLAASQREQRLKFELVHPIASVDRPTALLSFNYHQSHFGGIYGIRTEAGEAAHTACVGFGLERVALALFRTHGLDPAVWPARAREALWS